MANNLMFNSGGSNPSLGIMTGNNSNPLGIGSTPQSKALNSFATGGVTTPRGNVGVMGQPTQNIPGIPGAGSQPGAITGSSPIAAAAPGNYQGLLPPTNQDIKSHQTADGTTQTYYPSSQNKVSSSTDTAKPVAPVTDNSQTKSSVDSTGGFNGLVNAGTLASAGSFNAGTNNVNTGTGMIQNQINNPNPNIGQAQKGLLDIAQNQTPGVINAQNEFSQFSKANPYLTNDIAFNPNVAGFLAAGQGQVYGANAAAEQAALGQNVTNALAGENQQISAGTNAGSQALTGQAQGITAGTNLANTGTTQQSTGISGLGTAAGRIKPEANAAFFGSPTTGGLVGGTGGGGTWQTGNSLIDQSVSSAVQLATQGGTSVNDPQIQKLLAPGGAPAQLAFTKAMQEASNGTYNPTTQSAIAGQNAQQAVDYGKAATDLDTQIKNLDNISILATNFLNSKDFLNPNEVPDINAGIGTYVGKFIDPSAKLQYNAIIGDISKFTSSILAANNGQIPSAVTQQLQSFDPSTLNVKQLVPYLQTLKELGSNQLSVLQSQQSSSANQGAGAYTGTPTSVDTTPTPTTKSSVSGGSQITNPYAQAGIGTVMNMWNGATAIIGGLATKLFELL